MEYSLPSIAARRAPSAARADRARLRPALPPSTARLRPTSSGSTASGRATATISVHQGVDLPDEPLFRACEEIFAAHDGRPHWGKVHYRSGAELAALYPRWNDWWHARDRWDPRGLFLGPHLRSLRPA
jgi:L-gulonolactone oxidase